MRTKKKRSILKYKIIYTFFILVIYILGKNLPLYGVDFNAYSNSIIDTESILQQTIGGDIYQCSVFALGISPYMIASILTQIISACRSAEAKSRISPKKMNRMTLVMTLIFAIVQAIMHANEMQYVTTGHMLILSKVVVVLELITGAIMILWLSDRNKKYGIGGQTAIIFVNILDGIIATLSGHNLQTLKMPIIVSFVAMFIILVMENTEKRIPVQRISIHNIYADTNYLAVKLNPIGVMPAMFSTACFMVPQLVVSGLLWLFPANLELLWWQENLTLSRPVGIVVYVLLLYAITMGFSGVFINPREITEQFLKSGDSILNLHAGKDTRKYLSRVIRRISFFSATVMSICLGGAMLLQLTGDMESTLVMLPASVMMLTGMWCNLSREMAAIRDLEAYKPFV